VAVYTTLTQKDIEYILQEYNLMLNSFSEIKSGILNTNYFLSTNKGKYVLRIFEGERTFEDENLELEFLIKLNTVIPCCLPLKTKQNKNFLVFKDKMVALFYFIEGQPITKVNIENIKQIACYLGKLHSYSFGKRLDRKSRIDLNFYYNNIDFSKIDIDMRHKEIILTAYNRIKDIDYNHLPFGVIHNDIFPDNVFIDNNNIVGILDFNEAQTGPFIFDLAIVINYWIKIYNLDKAKETLFIDTFLLEYEKQRILTKEEKLLLPVAIINMALVFILLRIYKFHIEKKDNIFIENKCYSELIHLLSTH